MSDGELMRRLQRREREEREWRRILSMYEPGGRFVAAPLATVAEEPVSQPVFVSQPMAVSQETIERSCPRSTVSITNG